MNMNNFNYRTIQYGYQMTVQYVAAMILWLFVNKLDAQRLNVILQG